jgi:hypothetical protein
MFVETNLNKADCFFQATHLRVSGLVVLLSLLLFTGTASAAVGTDVTTSQDSSSKNTTITTQTFSTLSGGELLLAFARADLSKASTAGTE